MEIKNRKSLNFNEIEPETLGNSQKGQDSKILAVLNHIGPVEKYCVEFGAYDGVQFSNTWYLREKLGWDSLLLEGGMSNPAINLHDEFLTIENICDVFRKYKVPKEPGFISVDVDGMDFWLLDALFKDYLPSLIMVECNVRFNPDQSVVQKYNPVWSWNGGTQYGSSPLAFAKMAAKYDYYPVGIFLDDLFLVHGKYLTEAEKTIDFQEIYGSSNVSLYDSHGDCAYNPEQFEIYE